MKQATIITTLLLAASFGAGSLTASAAEAPTVTVTIADAEGNLALTQGEIAVIDSDGDGALTMHDALYLAHEAYYAEGAAGYAAEQTDYGLSMTKLWGCENGSGYGYFINHVSPDSLLDEVKNGDVISAFVYTDNTAFSDTYCFFDVQAAEINSGETVTLTLSAASYDAEWNPITVPVADAEILIDGSASTYKTNAGGSVDITLTSGGEHIISAKSETMLLVPPCCKVTVAGESAATTTTAPAAQTGDTSPVAALGFAGVALAAMITIKRRMGR